MKIYSMVMCILSAQLLQGAITLKTDFLRSAKTYKNVQFPLEINGYLDLSLRVVVNDISEPEGLTACIERRVDGELTSSYSGFFPYGKEMWVEFPDGNVGPKLLFEYVASTSK